VLGDGLATELSAAHEGWWQTLGGGPYNRRVIEQPEAVQHQLHDPYGRRLINIVAFVPTAVQVDPRARPLRSP